MYVTWCVQASVDAWCTFTCVSIITFLSGNTLDIYSEEACDAHMAYHALLVRSADGALTVGRMHAVRATPIRVHTCTSTSDMHGTYDHESEPPKQSQLTRTNI